MLVKAWLTRPSVASAQLKTQERELERQVEDLAAREGELGSQAAQHRDEMAQLQASGRKLLHGKNRALPFALGSFGLMVTGLIGGMITQQPWLMWVGVGGLLGTMVSAAFLETSQDHLDEMGQKFEQHQTSARTLEDQKEAAAREREGAQGDLAGHRQVVTMAEQPAVTGVQETEQGVTVGGVVVRRRGNGSST